MWLLLLLIDLLLKWSSLANSLHSSYVAYLLLPGIFLLSGNFSCQFIVFCLGYYDNFWCSIHWGWSGRDGQGTVSSMAQAEGQKHTQTEPVLLETMPKVTHSLLPTNSRASGGIWVSAASLLSMLVSNTILQALHLRETFTFHQSAHFKRMFWSSQGVSYNIDLRYFSHITEQVQNY